MKSSWTIGRKLMASFLLVSAITAILGGVGYYAVNTGAKAIDELGVVRLPSVDSLLVVSEAQTAVDGAENALLSRDIDLKARQEKYETFAAAWKRAEDAWKVYEPLPQTAEEEQTWKQFVPAWKAWKKDHETYVAMSKEYDKYVEAGFKADELYKKMTDQALVANYKSFDKAAELIQQILANYTGKAGIGQQGSNEGGASQSQPAAGTDNNAFNRVAFLTTWALQSISADQNTIDSAENYLLSREIDLKARQEKYVGIGAAWKDINVAWKVHESLPQTPEEAELWKKFVPAWNA